VGDGLGAGAGALAGVLGAGVLAACVLAGAAPAGVAGRARWCRWCLVADRLVAWALLTVEPGEPGWPVVAAVAAGLLAGLVALAAACVEPGRKSATAPAVTTPAAPTVAVAARR
jgi:hypothetical protein